MGWDSGSLSRIPESKKHRIPDSQHCQEVRYLPIMVVPPFSVSATTASISAFVPLANFSNSNTPAGLKKIKFFQLPAPFWLYETFCHFNLSSQYSTANIFFSCHVADFARNCFNLWMRYKRAILYYRRCFLGHSQGTGFSVQGQKRWRLFSWGARYQKVSTGTRYPGTLSMHQSPQPIPITQVHQALRTYQSISSARYITGTKLALSCVKPLQVQSYPFQTTTLALLTTSAKSSRDLGPQSRPIQPSCSRTWVYGTQLQIQLYTVGTKCKAGNWNHRKPTKENISMRACYLSSKTSVGDPDRVGSASFFRSRIEIGIHPGHADPDPVDPDQYQGHLWPISLRQDKPMWTSTAVNISFKNSDFPICVKLGVGSAGGSTSFWCRSGSGSVSKWKFGSRCASKRCRTLAVLETYL